jgi:hypothetical protein
MLSTVGCHAEKVNLQVQTLPPTTVFALAGWGQESSSLVPQLSPYMD